MKKKIVLLVFCVIVLLVFLVVVAKSITNSNKKNIQENKEFNDRCIEWLFLNGDFKVEANEIIASDLTSNVNKVNSLVYFYNYYNEDKVDRKQLMQEYKNFCEGIDSYQTLVKYCDFLDSRSEVSIKDATADSFDVRWYLDACLNVLFLKYGDNVEHTELDVEEINTICATVMDNSVNLYRDAISDYIGKKEMRELYDLYFVGFDDEDLTVVDSEKYTLRDDGKVKYFVKNRTLEWFSEEEKYYVNKVEVLESRDYHIFGVRIGDDLDTVKSTIGSSQMYDYGFVLATESDEELIYSRDSFRITYKFDSGICDKISIEIVE